MRQRIPIFYNALMLTAVNLLLRLAGTGFQVYLSGRIGAAGIGLLQLVLSVGSLALVAGIAGIRTATMYLTARQLGRQKPENVMRVLSACILYSILCSGTAATGLYALAPAIARDWIGDIRTLGALQLLAVFLPVSCLCGVMTGYFTAANRIATLAAVEVAEQVCSITVTMLALVFWAGSDPGKACQSVIVGSSMGAVLTLSCLVILRLRERPLLGKPLPIKRELLSTALPLALADDLKSGITTAENLMVPKRLALCTTISSPLAAFGTVSGMVFPILMFPACILYALAELLIPELARCAAAGSKLRIRYLARRSLRLALLYGLIMGGLEWLLAPQLCIQLYASTEAGIQLRRYALLIPMLYCDAIIDAMNKGLGQQAICVRYNILTAALDVLGLYLLLPKYGMDGYFFSFLLTHILNFLLSLKLLLKVTGFRLPLKAPALCSICTMAALIFASLCNGWAGKALGYLTVLLWLLWFVGVIRKEDLRWLKGLIRLRS